MLSGKAIERISKSVLDELVVTDTIPLSAAGQALRQDPPAERGGAAGGDHPPHQRRGVGELAVHRLSFGGDWNRLVGARAIGRDVRTPCL